MRQPEALGLGHAVLMAKELVGNEPFAVLLPDDIVDAEVPCMKQMVAMFEQTGGSILGSEVVEGDAIQNYGCLDCAPVDGNPRLHRVRDMVEKPKPHEAPSQNAIIGRYILTPRIFDMLEAIEPGAGGELQLTDGIRALAHITGGGFPENIPRVLPAGIRALLQHESVYGFNYEGKRHDAGDKLGFLKATVEFALKRDDLGPKFREWLRGVSL